MRHFPNILSISEGDLAGLLDQSAKLKARHLRRIPTHSLTGRVIALVFEKPSLRTRVSFEAGIAQLGGTSLFFPGNEVGLGWREPVEDVARVLGRYVDAIVLRVFRQETVDEMAKFNLVPVVNGLSDRSHPCQALADLFTIQEAFSEVAGKTIVFVGDGNNVAMSLAAGCAKLGVKFVLACPKDYSFDDTFLSRYRQTCPDAELPQVVHTPEDVVSQADILYTDVWTSMGQEAEREERLRKFAPFQINTELLAQAPSHCRVLHCLPAHRGEEITAEVIEGPQSLVFDQAENRMHVQKAVMEWLLPG